MTWLDVFVALVYLCLFLVLLNLAVGTWLAYSEVRRRVRERRRPPIAKCECGAWTVTTVEWININGWRHTSGMCCPVLEVIP